MAKREPTVLDEWRFSGRHPYWYSLPNFPEWMKDANIGLKAKYFVLDEASVSHISELSRTQADLVKELAEFAIPPYETIAISWAMPYELEFPESDMLLFVRNPADFVGFLHHKIPVEGNDWTAVPFMHRSSGDAETEATTAAWVVMITTFFLLLNSRKLQVVSEQPRVRTLRRGKPVQYFGYSTVRIELATPKQLRRHFSTGTHATPRRHEVMGHFVHRGGQKDCTHDWVKVERDDDIPRWECSSCERKRTWRKAFERGDAGKGFVHQKYEVTADGPPEPRA